MRIDKVSIRNLRAAKDLEVSFGSMTALVGANGSGKSTVIFALRVFFGKAPVTSEDYYNGNTDEDIIVTVTFGDLGPAARGRFSRYVGEGGGLEVSCIVHWDGAGAVRTLHGRALQNPDFAAVRAEARASVAKPLYEALAGRPGYEDLPRAWPGVQKAGGAMDAWEEARPDRCTRMLDGGQFFGPDGKGGSHLAGLVRFLHIPAEHDAAEGAGSALDELLDVTIQNALTQKDGYKALPGKIKKAWEEACRPSDLDETLSLSEALGVTLRSLVPGADIAITGRPPEPSVGKVRFDVYLGENWYQSPVSGAGHGTQRALAIAALLHLSRARADGESYAEMAYRYPPSSRPARAALARATGGAGESGADVRDAPSVVLAIEEPEMYQHPTRMRHLASLLRSLPDRGLAGVYGPMQVVYTTHSPHFVFADRIDQIRLVRTRMDRMNEPGVATAASATQADVQEGMRRCGAARQADGSVDYSLMMAMGPAACEGFFSSAVVLVEGPSDRIVLEAVAEATDVRLDALGVSIVPCESKSAMPLPIVVFRKLGIPVYAVWDADGDEGRQKAESERIAAALGHSGSDWRGRICGQFACLERDIEGAIRSDLERALGPSGSAGSHYDRILEERRTLHDISKKHSKALDAHLLMEEVREKGIRLETIESIVRQIAEMAEREAPWAIIPPSPAF